MFEPDFKIRHILGLFKGPLHVACDTSAFLHTSSISSTMSSWAAEAMETLRESIGKVGTAKNSFQRSLHIHNRWRSCRRHPALNVQFKYLVYRILSF